MTEQSAKRGVERRIAAKNKAGHRDGGGAFENIAGKCCGGQQLAAGAQHIGGADIAGADIAQIGCASEPGQQKAERYRTAQITEDQGRGILEHS